MCISNIYDAYKTILYAYKTLYMPNTKNYMHIKYFLHIKNYYLGIQNICYAYKIFNTHQKLLSTPN